MKTAVIGVGNMGSKYACLIQNGQIPGLELAAITRVLPGNIICICLDGT